MTHVQDVPERDRYEIDVDGEPAGFAAYELSDDTIAFAHTEIGEAFGGRGLATLLVSEALADARRRGLAVLPFCPFVRRMIAEHPEQYLDLVPVDARAAFELG